MCFCGHLLNQHKQYKADIPNTSVPCQFHGCQCKAFKFMPARPEDVGEFWHRKRPGFNPKTFRLNCKSCKHPHEDHHPNGIHQCKKPGEYYTIHQSVFRDEWTKNMDAKSSMLQLCTTQKRNVKTFARLSATQKRYNAALHGQKISVRLRNLKLSVRLRPFLAICNFVRLKLRAGLWNFGSRKSFSAAQFSRSISREPRPGVGFRVLFPCLISLHGSVILF